MRALHSYSDKLSSAPVTLRRLIEKDERIVAFTIEPDGVFIYTNSNEWCNDDGAGTFRADTVREAIADYKMNVRKA